MCVFYLSHGGSLGVFCWVLGVQGFNSPCDWTDALVVRPGLRVCFALMVLSHGPTNSLEICFFNWRALVLTSGWTLSLDFHLFFLFFHVGWFCFMESVRLCMKCQEPLVCAEIISCWWGPGCPVDVWLICGSSSVFCITFSFCTWTRLDCLIHLVVLMQLRDTMSSENIRNMCPFESADVFFGVSFFVLTIRAARSLGMAISICWLDGPPLWFWLKYQ